MANETEQALAQLGLLNRQFAEATQPVSNYAAQNMQLAVAQERAAQAQRDKMAELQFQRDAQLESQRVAAENALKLTKVQADLNQNNALAVAKFTAGHEDDVRVKLQADTIRANQQARRVVGDKIAASPDTPEGNRALIAAYTAATSDPKTIEKLDTDDAVSLTKQIKDVVGKLTSNVPNSPQSRQAVAQFLATPGVSELLINKGKLTADEISAVRQSGDPTKLAALIDQVASKASWFYGQDRNVLSQLTSAFNQALLATGAVQSPDQLVNANFLNALTGQLDTVIKRGNIVSPDSWNSIGKAGGFTAEPIKLPPPPASGGVTATPTVAPRPSPIGENPFGSPPAYSQSDRAGLAGRIENATVFAGAGQAPVPLRLPNGALNPDLNNPFTPTRLAQDPATEYAMRAKMLDTHRTYSAAVSGLPFTGKADYNAFDQMADENRLAAVVKQIYSPAPTKDRLYQNQVPVLQPSEVPVIQPDANFVPVLQPTASNRGWNYPMFEGQQFRTLPTGVPTEQINWPGVMDQPLDKVDWNLNRGAFPGVRVPDAPVDPYRPYL